MPHRNIWVRKADLTKWEAIPDKAEWLHNHLNRDLSGTIKRVQEILNKPPVAPKTPVKPVDVNPKSHTYVPDENQDVYFNDF